MNFVWDIKEDHWKEFTKAARLNRDDFEHTTLGFCRVGDLCFDIRTWGEHGLNIGYELYCGGIDTGYGYSSVEALSTGKYKSEHDVPDELLYPYDEVTYDDLPQDLIWVDLDTFKKESEVIFKEDLEVICYLYNKGDLIAKANEPLHVW